MLFLEAIVYVINIKQVVADPDLVIAGDSERIWSLSCACDNGSHSDKEKSEINLRPPPGQTLSLGIKKKKKKFTEGYEVNPGNPILKLMKPKTYIIHHKHHILNEPISPLNQINQLSCNFIFSFK